MRAARVTLRNPSLSAGANVPNGSELTPEQFGFALKYFGTGIQLETCDVLLVLGAEALSFDRFTAFLGAGR